MIKLIEIYLLIGGCIGLAVLIPILLYFLYLKYIARI